MLKNIIIIHLLIFCLGQQIQAQEASKEAVIQELQKVSRLYTSAPYLSFDVDYYCSQESTPSVAFDSLHGTFKLKGSNYWYSIDSTVSVTTGGYNIILFKEDLLMYLNKPLAGTPFSNPTAMMDSILLNSKNITCSMKELKTEKVILFEFSPVTTYKRMEYHINKKTGLLTRMVSLVRSEQLYDASVRNLIDTAAQSYANVDVFYRNYSKTTFDEGIFDVSHYFRKEGDEYIPAQAYETYQIFLGNTNL